MKSYTVKELDDLRFACEMRWLYGTTNVTSCMSRPYREQDKSHAVEELVRTYMTAGLTAEDIYAADKPTPVHETSDSTTA